MKKPHRLFSAAVQLLGSKGRISDAEFRFLEGLRRRLALQENEARNLLRDALTAVPVGPPFESGERRRMFRALLEATACDGIVSPQESEFLRSWGRRMKISPASLDAAAKRALRWAGPLRPDESALRRVRELTSEIRSLRKNRPKDPSELDDLKEFRRRLLGSLDLPGHPAASFQRRLHDMEDQALWWQRERARIQTEQGEVTQRRAGALSREWSAKAELEARQERGLLEGLMARFAPESQPEFREAKEAKSDRFRAQRRRIELAREEQRCVRCLESLEQAIRNVCDELADRL